MKLSELKGEDALDVLADMIEPASKIAADEELQHLFKVKNTPMARVVKTIVKRHKSDVMDIMVALNGDEAKTYTLPVIIAKLLELLNDEGMKDFFKPAPAGQKSSGSATESTEEKEQ